LAALARLSIKLLLLAGATEEPRSSIGVMNLFLNVRILIEGQNTNGADNGQSVFSCSL